MQRCVLFTGDQHLIYQATEWLKPEASKFRLDIFSSIEQFRGYRTLSADGQRSEYLDRDITLGPESTLVRLLIVDAELLNVNTPIEDLQAFARVLREMGLVSSISPPRLMVLSYDPGAINPEVYQIDLVDDLLFKPLDRQLFLQKIELFASDDLFVKPSYLFNAGTDMVVEIGKDIFIEQISEYGLVVRNPIALNPGLFATIHCDALGAGSNARVIGRVYRSLPHPVHRGEALVHFMFFSLNTDQLHSLRHLVRDEQTMAKILRTAPKRVDKSLTEPPARRFAVIDMNPTSGAETVDLLGNGYTNTEVVLFSSYAKLQGDLLKLMATQAQANVTSNANQAAAVEATAQAFPGDQKLYFTIRAGSGDLLSIDPPLAPTDKVFGRTVQEHLSNPHSWFKSIEKEDKPQVVELIEAASKGAKAQMNLRMQMASGEIVYIEVAGFLAKSASATEGAHVRLDLKQTTLAKIEAIPKRPTDDPKYFKFDAIFVDASLIQPSPAEWIETFQLLLKNAGVNGAKDVPPRVFVIADASKWSRIEDYRFSGYFAYFLRPLDRRLMLLKVQALMPDLKLHHEIDAPPVVRVDKHGKLAKEITLKSLSEFGLEFEQKTPLRERVLIKFFSPFFGEDGGWVTARCRYSLKVGRDEKNPKFQHRFIFFGVSSDVFQRIRRWIREDHIAKKEGA